MAYIIGIMTKAEAETLRRRGWEIEDPPPALASDTEYEDVCGMVFVDSNIFDIMSGADWDMKEKAGKANK